MKKQIKLKGNIVKVIFIALIVLGFSSCKQEGSKIENKVNNEAVESNKPEYFLLRPHLEKMYGYTQAVKVGNLIKVGGVISIDDKGAPLGINNYAEQMKNCYASLEKVLAHYGCSFNDVILENIYTTSMQELQKNAAFRHSIYKNHFPTGSWIGVKELGLKEMMIEIELEALVPDGK